MFGPETVGDMLRANLADRPVSDFQDWAAWAPLVAASLIEITRMTGQNVITPQTVLKRDYLDKILVPLRVAGLEVFHVVLDADEAVLRSRLEGSDDASVWRLDHLDEYQAARQWMVEAADLVVDTAATTPAQIARRIHAALPGMAAKPDAAKKPAAPAKPVPNGTKMSLAAPATPPASATPAAPATAAAPKPASVPDSPALADK